MVSLHRNIFFHPSGSFGSRADTDAYKYGRRDQARQNVIGSNPRGGDMKPTIQFWQHFIFLHSETNARPKLDN